MKIETNTSLIPIINVSMYDTPISPNEVSQRYWEKEREMNDNKFLYEDNFNISLYYKMIMIAISNIIPIDILKNRGVTFDFLDIYSPREYNFYTDQIDIELTIRKDYFTRSFNSMKRSKKLRPLFDAYIKHHWTSHDGFISFMPESFDDIALDFDDLHMISAIVTLMLVGKGIINDKLLENEEENNYTSELYYAVEEFDTSFIKSKQIVNDELVTLYNDTNTVNELYHSIYLKYGDLWADVSLEEYDDFSSTVEYNDCTRFILWAYNNEYDTVDKLKELANK